VPAAPTLSPPARLSPATPCCAQGQQGDESILAILPWWGWVGLCVIVALLACCCLICTCAVVLMRRKRLKKPSESKRFDGIEVDGVFAGNADQRCAPDVQHHLEEDSPTARSSGISCRSDPSVSCVMTSATSDVPLHSSKSWQAENMAGSLAVPVKFSSTLGSSCRMEYEEDRSRSQASRSQPPRCYNGRQRSDSVSQRASTGVGHIINTLRDSFGHVRV